LLNDAGYYTSSARTPEQAAQLATKMNCDFALICYSFGSSERRRLSELLRRLSPETIVLLLESGADDDKHVLLTRIQQSAAGLVGTLPFWDRSTAKDAKDAKEVQSQKTNL
jgi:hypothetical protein